MSNNRIYAEPSNPCWYLSGEGYDSVDQMHERQEREMYDYSSDISLSEALKIFNAEQRCVKEFSFPDLTEDEIISAIIVSPDYTSRDEWTAQSDELRFIFEKRRLPKGSLLVSEGAGTYNSTFLKSSTQLIKVNGQRIYLLFGLDKNNRMEPLKREQIFLIKKTLFGLEGI